MKEMAPCPCFMNGGGPLDGIWLVMPPAATATHRMLSPDGPSQILHIYRLRSVSEDKDCQTAKYEYDGAYFIPSEGSSSASSCNTNQDDGA
jgi:hypothetical protein